MTTVHVYSILWRFSVKSYRLSSFLIYRSLYLRKICHVYKWCGPASWISNAVLRLFMKVVCVVNQLGQVQLWHDIKNRFWDLYKDKVFRNKYSITNVRVNSSREHLSAPGQIPGTWKILSNARTCRQFLLAKAPPLVPTMMVKSPDPSSSDQYTKILFAIF